MRNHLSMLVSDFYKQCHAEQYPKGLNFIAAYFTPRMSRLEKDSLPIIFGVQGFIKDYLIERFNDSFFEKPIEEVVSEYERVIRNTFTKNYCESQKIKDLHKLGYLPIQIKSLPEGTRVPIKTPCIEISSTKKGFEWVAQFIESIMSCQLWYPMTIAAQAYKYRKIVDKYYDLTVDDCVPRSSAIAEFGFRGQQGLEGAILASAAFLTSFDKTATIPAILYLEDYYGGEIRNGSIASGMLSTEHSVMCSNYAIDGDEATFVKRLLSRVYPSENISMVSDSYDYWNLVNNILARRDVKEVILSRTGTLFVRGDSGDPADIICGTCENFEESKDPEKMGTIECLWNIFGGHINSKGYKVLNPRIRGIYGDGITPLRAKVIYERLHKKGFASNNVVFGAGSFSMQCAMKATDKNYYSLEPFTRDSYGIAIKATFIEVDGMPIKIFKDPKTDKGFNFKKSHKGMCCVYYDDNFDIVFKDGYNKDNLPHGQNLLQTVFKNGKVHSETTIYDIRDRLHNGNF